MLKSKMQKTNNGEISRLSLKYQIFNEIAHKAQLFM